jgi:hypothetical protein
LIVAAQACSGDETGAPAAPNCTATSCADANATVDAGLTDDATIAGDATTGIDAGSTSDAPSSNDDAADAARDNDADKRTDGASPDGARPTDAPHDNGPIADALVDSGMLVDATSDPAPPPDGGDLDEVLRFNDIQMEGTHNSYHVETTGGVIPAWKYTHKPLDVQLEMQGVRQFELDFHYNGPNDFPVHHVPPDVGTTCASLAECLGLLKTWSDAHPRHAPLVVLLEQKDDFDTTKISGHYDELDAHLLSIWPRDRVITPDDVRGSRATLREAVTTDGWPTLGKCRGHILFAFIDDSTEYMMGHPNLENRVIFPRAAVADPFAAFVLLDNAESSEAEITDAVRQGFIVRTRYNGEELKLTPATVESAQRGGAQCVSGDFPADFTLTGGAPSRCNPVRAPVGCTAAAVEQL